MALIDSGNTSIQLPSDMFDQLLREMQRHERTIYKGSVEGKKIMIARKKCSTLYDKLQDIEFKLHHTTIVIKPQGYLYSMGGQNADCFIGIESIPDNNFRLGTIFLRNFYTALDFEHNFIMIGVNNGSSERAKAYI